MLIMNMRSILKETPGEEEVETFAEEPEEDWR
jgi:hypothetical protein